MMDELEEEGVLYESPYHHSCNYCGEPSEFTIRGVHVCSSQECYGCLIYEVGIPGDHMEEL